MTRMLYFFLKGGLNTLYNAGHKSRLLTDVLGLELLSTGPQPGQEGWHWLLRAAQQLAACVVPWLAATASFEAPRILFAVVCSR